MSNSWDPPGKPEVYQNEITGPATRDQRLFLGVGLSRCPGEGRIHAAKTRREMQDREAFSRLPPSDAGKMSIFL